MHKPSRCVAEMLCLGFSLIATTIAMPSRARAQRVQGFDVSEFQGSINWAKAYNAGIRFAFIRSSRGGPLGAQHTDSGFLANMAGSSNVIVGGQPVTIYTGNYHFGRPDTIVIPPGVTTKEQIFAAIAAHAQSEADYFYQTVSPYLAPGHLRPVLDLEIAGVNTPDNKAGLSFWANSFLDRFESRSGGVEPLIYSNTNYATNFFDTSLSGRDVWIANWSTPSSSQTGDPPSGVFPDWRFWQYSSPNGLGPQYGVSSTDIDLDVAQGNMAYLQSFLITVPEPGMIGLAAVWFEFVAMRGRRQSRASGTIHQQG